MFWSENQSFSSVLQLSKASASLVLFFLFCAACSFKVMKSLKQLHRSAGAGSKANWRTLRKTARDLLMT